MELFDIQYVYESHEEANDLIGKDVFVADSIKELASIVNHNDPCYFALLVSADASDYPFKSDSGLRYKYVYYDPNYDIKVAWKDGTPIQWLDGVGVWHDFDSSTEPKCEPGVTWRVKPMDEYKVGDMVHVLSDNIEGIVTAVHKGRLPNEYYVGGEWYEAYEIQRIERKSSTTLGTVDDNPADFWL